MPIMAGIIVLAEPIMVIIAGKEFAGSGKILRVLALAIFGLSFGNIFGYIALAINRQKQAIFIYLSDAIITVAAYFYFIPKFGIYGAAGTAIFSEIYAGLALMILCAVYAKFMPSIKQMLKIMLASFLMAVAVQKLQPLNVVFSILLGMSVYAILILLFKVISKETIKEIV